MQSRNRDTFNFSARKKTKEEKRKEKENKKPPTFLSTLFEDKFIYNGQFKNYSGNQDIERNWMNNGFGTEYNDTRFLFHYIAEVTSDPDSPYSKNLPRNNNFGFSIKGKLFFDYDILLAYGPEKVVTTIGNIGYDLGNIDIGKYKTKNSLFVKFDATFNNYYNDYDIYVGVDTSSNIDGIQTGVKLSKIVNGNSRLTLYGNENSHDGISIIPYAEAIIDKKRGGSIYVGYEMWLPPTKKQIGNENKDYNNFQITANLIKDKTLQI